MVNYIVLENNLTLFTYESEFTYDYYYFLVNNINNYEMSNIGYNL